MAMATRPCPKLMTVNVHVTSDNLWVKLWKSNVWPGLSLSDLFNLGLVYFHHRPSAFEIPYTFNIHDSPVTCTQFCNDCPRDFITSLGTTASSRTRKRQLQRGDSMQVNIEFGYSSLVFSVTTFI